MGLTRAEVNLRRLIAKCELYAKETQRKDKVEQCLESIDDLLVEMEKQTDKPDQNTMLEYYKRFESLKQRFAVDVVPKTMEDVSETPKLRQKLIDGVREEKPNEKLSIKAAKSDNTWSDNRKELLGYDDETSKSRSPSTMVDDNNVDMLLKHHENLQDNILEEMIAMTGNLKEQSKIANQIIRGDTKVLKSSGTLTERNLSQLKQDSEKLSEHSKRAWRCWLWVMIVIVMVVFINMILFMKVMKKRS